MITMITLTVGQPPGSVGVGAGVPGVAPTVFLQIDPSGTPQLSSNHNPVAVE